METHTSYVSPLRYLGIIINEHAVTRSADDGSSETTASEQLLPSWFLNNFYSSAYIHVRLYPASVRCPDPSLASLTSSRAPSERCQNTSGRSPAVQQVKIEQTLVSTLGAETSGTSERFQNTSRRRPAEQQVNKHEQTVMLAFAAEPSTNKPEQTVMSAFAAEPSTNKPE